jgi:hypothetical protein
MLLAGRLTWKADAKCDNEQNIYCKPQTKKSNPRRLDGNGISCVLIQFNSLLFARVNGLPSNCENR